MNIPLDTNITQNDIFQLFEDENKPDHNFRNEATRSQLSSNSLSNIFFSQQNVDLLNQAIRYGVWKKSCKKHIIDPQNTTQLRLVMRSIYYQYSKNRPYGILDQIKILNSYVLDFCIPRILSEIGIYHRYRQDIYQLPAPLSYGDYSTLKGTKVLELKDF